MILANLNPYAISGLIIAVIYFPLTLFIFIKGKNLLAKIYSFHTGCVTVWGIFCALIALTKNPQETVRLFDVAYIFVLFIPVLFQHAIFLLTNYYRREYFYFIYAQAVIFAMLTATGAIHGPPILISNQYYWISANIFFTASFLIWMTIVVIAHTQLILYYKKNYPEQKAQIRSAILAAIGFTGGVTNFLQAYISLYPYGNFFIPVHAIFITYTIFKHDLLDIKLVYKKSLLYSILIALISSLYLITVFLTENFLRVLFNYQSFILSSFVAFIIGLAFFPLRNRIERIIDKYFFKGTTEEIAEQNERLRQEVAETERYKTLSTLASGIAHEIKNPMTAMQTFCEYLPQKLDDKEFLIKFSQITKRESERINSLIYQLLAYGKPSPPLKEPIAIHAFIDETIHFVQGKCREHNISIIKSFQADDLILQLDSNQFRQAILNLFMNAIEAMSNGGKLTIETKTNAQYFQIIVRDTGCGIAKKDLPHIFDPFFSKKEKGTGLGLAITQTNIHNQGGTIEVNSEEGVGTEIVVEFSVKGISERNL